MLLLLNKPFGVICQFSPHEQHASLADHVRVPNVYPAGRLDTDSEGLVLLTDDGRLQHQISHPMHKKPKIYCVQVEGAPSEAACEQLRRGVELNDGVTQPCDVQIIDEPEWLWARNPPIRERKSIPTHWLQITLTEGRNRQVRRMTAAVGLPTLRLIRTHIGDYSLWSHTEMAQTLTLGQWVWIDPNLAPIKPTAAAHKNLRHPVQRPTQRTTQQPKQRSAQHSTNAPRPKRLKSSPSK